MDPSDLETTELWKFSKKLVLTSIIRILTTLQDTLEI